MPSLRLNSVHAPNIPVNRRVFAESPPSLSWKNINAVAENANRSKSFLPFRKKVDTGSTTILENVNGRAYNKEILAIMGASGAGKTTLLNILTGIKSRNVRWTGSVQFNGLPITKDKLSKLSAYVKQFEDYVPYLTVQEHLKFYATLKLSKELNAEQVQKKIENLIDELQLRKCATSVVGIHGVTKTLSGGEYRRLVLATELITESPIILCDEPTTGLDSYLAHEVIASLRLIADRGKTVICTIHQPSSSVFASFDRLMLLSDGRCAYSGLIDEATDFFNSLALPAPNNTNPADHFIKMLAVVPGHEDACKLRNKIICDKFKTIGARRNSSVLWKSGISKSFENELLDAQERFGSSFCTQLKILTWRLLLVKWRTDRGILGTVGIQAIFTVIFCLIYWQQENSDIGAANINNAIFMTFMGYSYFYLHSLCIEISSNMGMVYKEINRNLYSSIVFLASSLISQVIWLTTPMVTSYFILYFSLGVNPDWKVCLKILAVNYLSVICSLFFSIFYTALLNNFYLIINFSHILLSLLIIPSGFWVNIRTIPDYLMWLRDISWFSFTLESTFNTIWKDFGFLECTNPSPDGGCIDSGTKLLRKLGYEIDYFSRDLGIIAGLGAAYGILGVVLFYVRCKTYKE